MPGYPLPAISAVSVLFSVGLAGPVPARLARTLMSVVAAVMFAFALLIPFRYILPAYAEPPLLSPADVQDIQNPLGVNSTQEHLPILDPQGQVADRSAVFGRIKIVPRERPEYVIDKQVYYDLGGKVALIGYELTSPVDRAGLDLRLYWQALSDLDEDDTVFVHGLDEEGRILAQQDNQPRNGSYPTGLWDEGEIVEDLYHLTVPAGRPSVLLAVGMYRLETLERLAVFDESGQRLAGDQMILRE